MRTASSVHQRLEDYWHGLRLQQMDIPAIHLVKTDDVKDTSPLMMDSVEMYLSIKGKDDRTFIRTARRNGEYVSKVLGNRPITSYSSSEAAQFRDWCFEQGMNINTVKRVFASVRSIINRTMREHGIEGSNAFSGTFIPDRGDASTRQPIPTDKLRTIQRRCQTTDDEPRWLVALISDTGMRLSEAAGLARRDIVLDADIPHVTILHIRGGVSRPKVVKEYYLLLDVLCGLPRGLWRRHNTPLTYSLDTAMTKTAKPTQPVLL